MRRDETVPLLPSDDANVDVERAASGRDASSASRDVLDAASSAQHPARERRIVAAALVALSACALVATRALGSGDVFARPSALGEGASGSACALEARADASRTCAAELMSTRKLWDRASAPAVDPAFESALYNCMSADTSSPTVVPSEGTSKGWETKPNEAYAYAFVHVPKAAGSYFIEMLKRNKNHETAVLGPPKRPNFMPNNWAPLNSMWAREIPKLLWTIRANRASKSGIFSESFMRQDYEAGRRMYFTGATAMGLCGEIDAPCAYITVIRDPMERLWSEYTYLCLEGSEDHTSWTPEEIEADASEGCPLDPVEWYSQKRSTAAQLTNLFAPRSGHTECGAAAAKANLASSCVRYIFEEDLEAGMARMREKLPDLAHLGEASGVKFNEQGWIIRGRNGSGGRLTPALAARLAAYRANETIVRGLRDFVHHDIDVYNFAKERYDAHWNRPLAPC